MARYLSEQSQQEQSSRPGTQASHQMSTSSDENELLLETLLELEHNQSDTVAMLRSKAQAELFTLSSQLSIVEDTEILKDVRHYINLAINIIKAKSSTPNSKLILTLSARREPANKQIEKQRSFFSTKRKRKHTQTRIRKPDDDLSTALLEKCAALYGEKAPSKNTISQNQLYHYTHEFILLLQECCFSFVRSLHFLMVLLFY